MRDDLLLYYENELNYIRQLGAEFSRKYPKIPGRLVLEADKCEDPHVERLLEAFSFMAARVHLKIDDEFPEITEALLSILYPHYIRPIPSMCIVEMHLDADPGGMAAPQSPGPQIFRHRSRYRQTGASGITTICRSIHHRPLPFQCRRMFLPTDRLNQRTALPAGTKGSPRRSVQHASNERTAPYPSTVDCRQ